MSLVSTEQQCSVSVYSIYPGWATKLLQFTAFFYTVHFSNPSHAVSVSLPPSRYQASQSYLSTIFLSSPRNIFTTMAFQVVQCHTPLSQASCEIPHCDQTVVQKRQGLCPKWHPILIQGILCPILALYSPYSALLHCVLRQIVSQSQASLRHNVSHSEV